MAVAEAKYMQPMTGGCSSQEHVEHGACANCCQQCNVGHVCPQCGQELTHNMKEIITQPGGKREVTNSNHPCLYEVD